MKQIQKMKKKFKILFMIMKLDIKIYQMNKKFRINNLKIQF